VSEKREKLTSKTVEPTVQAKGFPPNVLKCIPLAKEAEISWEIMNKDTCKLMCQFSSLDVGIYLCLFIYYF